MRQMHHYTEQEMQWLRDKVGTATYAELAIQFADYFGLFVTASSLKNKCRSLGIAGVHHPFTEEQDEWLREHCHEYANYVAVADAFNKRFGAKKTERGVQAHCAKFLKLISGRQAYKKGHQTWNNAPVGSESIHSNGYTYVKIKDTGLYRKTAAYLGTAPRQESAERSCDRLFEFGQDRFQHRESLLHFKKDQHDYGDEWLVYRQP